MSTITVSHGRFHCRHHTRERESVPFHSLSLSCDLSFNPLLSIGSLTLNNRRSSHFRCHQKKKEKKNGPTEREERISVLFHSLSLSLFSISERERESVCVSERERERDREKGRLFPHTQHPSHSTYRAELVETNGGLLKTAVSTLCQSTRIMLITLSIAI
jgi:hypothetical protein